MVDIRGILAGLQSHPAGRVLIGGINPSSADAVRMAGGQRPRPLLNIGGMGRRTAANRQVKGGRVSTSPRGFDQQQQGTDPLDDILSMMQEMLLGGQGQLDYGGLQSQIEAQINPVFDARRQAIENLMSRAQSRTTQNRQDVTGMYNALGENYEETGVESNESAMAAAAEAAALQGKLKSNIHGNYSRVQDEQADLFKQLGIEAAAPAILPDQAADQAFLESMTDQTGTANQQFLQNQGTIDQNYYRQGAPLARLQGANMSSDLMLMLENYLAEQGDVINELEASRQSEITGSFNQLAGQAQSEQDQNSQRLWERLMDMYNIQKDRSQPQQTGDPFMDSVMRAGLAPSDAMQAQDAWASIQQTPAALYGQAKDPRSGEMVKTTPARLQQEIRLYAKQNNLPPHITNALLQAAAQQSR